MTPSMVKARLMSGGLLVELTIEWSEVFQNGHRFHRKKRNQPILKYRGSQAIIL